MDKEHEAQLIGMLVDLENGKIDKMAVLEFLNRVLLKEKTK